MFREYLFNGYRRMAGELKFWVIPFSLGMQYPRFMRAFHKSLKSLFYRLCYLRVGQELRPLSEQQGRSYRVGSNAPLEHSRFMKIATTYQSILVRSFLALNFYQRAFQATLISISGPV